MYSVTVLTPGGRRQQVKVTPNTTILQILEEVCTKHGFNAQEYDLRHHNKVLDVSSMIRFTSLPNNAQLEMTGAHKLRQESPVTLGLQFETGERLTGTFNPSDSVWNVIVALKPEEAKSNNLVVIYMRNEIYGREKLERTSLRSLGLTGGRAMLRVLHKSPEELRVQANVSTVLMPRVTVDEESRKSPESLKKEIPMDLLKTPKPPSPKAVKKDAGSPDVVRKEGTGARYKSDSLNLRGNVFKNLLKDEQTKKSLTEGGRRDAGRPRQEIKLGPEHSSKAEERTNERKPKGAVETKGGEEAKVILLGERNAVAYNLKDVKPVMFEEEPEDFYDLTVYDAQLLMKQAKQLCADLEEAPLMTSAQREFERDKKVLSLLHQHKKTVLRVKFPDRTVLQGTFAPLETVSAVENFVAEYLDNPRIPFYLYTTPPKVILKSEVRLIECGCVPCSVLYFGTPQGVPTPPQYLKTEVLLKLSTPSGAALQAYEARGIEKPEAFTEEGEKRKWNTNTNISEAGPSGNQQWEEKPREQENSPQFKVPKWFKTNK